MSNCQISVCEFLSVMDAPRSIARDDGQRTDVGKCEKCRRGEEGEAGKAMGRRRDVGW